MMVLRAVWTCNSKRSIRSRIQWWVVDGTTAPHKDIDYKWMILHCGDALVLIFLFGVVSEVLQLPKQSRYRKRQPHPQFMSPPFIVARVSSWKKRLSMEWGHWLKQVLNGGLVSLRNNAMPVFLKSAMVWWEQSRSKRRHEWNNQPWFPSRGNLSSVEKASDSVWMRLSRVCGNNRRRAAVRSNLSQPYWSDCCLRLD